MTNINQGQWGRMFWWDVMHLEAASNLYVGYGSPTACADLARRVHAICMRSHWSAGDTQTPIPGGNSIRDAAVAAGLTGDALRRLDHAYHARSERRWARERAARSPALMLRDRLPQYEQAYRYGVSYPRKRGVWGWEKSLDAVRAHIEWVYRPGHTTEPFVQIVAQSPLDRLLGRGGRVIAEYEPGREWLSPLVAAGFVGRLV